MSAKAGAIIETAKRTAIANAIFLFQKFFFIKASFPCLRSIGIAFSKRVLLRK